MIQVTLPDGSKREYPGPVTVAEVAASIGAGLAKAALAGKVDGKVVDTSFTIDKDSPARGLYHSLGYEDLARNVLFPSAPKPYAVMGAHLPLRRR